MKQCVQLQHVLSPLVALILSYLVTAALINSLDADNIVVDDVGKWLRHGIRESDVHTANGGRRATNSGSACQVESEYKRVCIRLHDNYRNVH